MTPHLKMPRLQSILPLVLLACLAFPAQAQDADLGQDVETFLTHYLEATSSGDADAIRGALVDDERFAWIEDGAVRYRSANEVLEGLSSLPRNVEIVTELEGLEVVAVGTSGAHAWGTFTTTMEVGDHTFSYDGGISFVLERHDGGWKLVGGHTSSPQER